MTRKHYHNMVYCRFCGAEYDAGHPGGPFASDGEHDCGLWGEESLRILEDRLATEDYRTYQERDEIAAHLATIRSITP